MDVLRRARQIDFLEERHVFSFLREFRVFLFEDGGIRTLHRLVGGIVGAVEVDAFDEEQRQHLDALGPQPLLFVEVFLDRAADHLPLHDERLDIPMGFPNLEKLLIARNMELDELLPFPLAGRDLADPMVAVDLPPGGVVEAITGRHRHFAAVDGLRLLDIELDNGGNRSPGRFGAHEPHVGLVGGVGDRRRRHLDLLDELPLVGVDGIEPIDHVVLRGVGRRVAECAERPHLVEGLFALPLEAAVDALRLVDDDDRVG